MYLDHKTVFLAGSTGLAGTSIMNHILKDYPTVTIQASYFKQIKPFIRHKRIKYIYGDLRSEKACLRMIKGCDCAIMAAANTGGARIAVAKPWQQVDDNVIMNARLLSAFHHQKIKRAVYIGSATLYQEFEGAIREDEIDFNKDPHPAYLGVGWVMRFIEKLCQFWHAQTGIEIVMARCSNIFGPYAKFDPLTSNFVPAIIRKAVDKQDPFEVWGSPDVTRDVIYAEDFAKAIVMMLDNDNIKFDTFNIGSGTKTTVADVVMWALKYAGHGPSQIKYLTDKPQTIRFRGLDCSKAKKILGWQPQYTAQQGVAKTLEWWRNNRRYWRR